MFRDKIDGFLNRTGIERNAIIFNAKFRGDIIFGRELKAQKQEKE
jgi:hypothetical protein